ncbi:phosphatase PAP2 family protein [Neolewinella litorea]|uniref:Phosphatase PAP2 family protein n=1 Tax=Neolewinella litorea TaxID=2562452 RepID=A0A4S4NNF7_9BACT|nr:phosphatase PAP2 family protein [Neolewinella litorea]THH41382.1 phosphatase PAP2 family protein [Neolewinella litorea]
MMSLDHSLFQFINQELANPFLDAALPVYRDKLTWIPLYAAILWVMYRTCGARQTLYLLLCIGLVITVADQLAATVIKPWAGRLRPCADPVLSEKVRVLVSCGGQYSFPSNHATNHFALATVLSLTLVRQWQWRLLLWLWAATIALAQVYVGKHFPGDILAGAVLGMVIGALGVYLLRNLTRRRP